MALVLIVKAGIVKSSAAGLLLLMKAIIFLETLLDAWIASRALECEIRTTLRREKTCSRPFELTCIPIFCFSPPNPWR